MKLEKILLGTKNSAKIEELKFGLNNFLQGIEILTLNDFDLKDEPEETEETFEGNATLKAKFYAQKLNLSTIADDGGLIIPALNNEPGVKSKRWLGYDASDEELIEYTLKRMEKYRDNERIAYLETCLAFYDPETEKMFLEKEKIEGYIAYKPSSQRIIGYPFRSLFIVKKFNKYYDELSEKEHFEINHRLKALERLVEKLKIVYS
jgi:XTP/dITP diphosphohydrolase